jgi:Mlc titration factor MtfA (ptsG expression regulator)
MFSWLKKRRRRKLLRGDFPESWRPYLGQVPLYTTLDADERTTLENDLRIIVAEKHWEECGGMKITDEVKVVIAAQAALLILNIEHDYYRNVQSILVYPDTFKVPHRERRYGQIVHEGASPTLGLASMQGPVVLAWDAVQRGNENPEDARNVVLHEFAHKLDMLDRFADGAPPLSDRKQYRAWSRIMTEEYDNLIDDAERGRRTLLDKYGATNPAEFFAVATELFFEKSRQMRKRHPELYSLFVEYYRQDPAGRLDSNPTDR